MKEINNETPECWLMLVSCGLGGFSDTAGQACTAMLWSKGRWRFRGEQRLSNLVWNLVQEMSSVLTKQSKLKHPRSDAESGSHPASEWAAWVTLMNWNTNCRCCRELWVNCPSTRHRVESELKLAACEKVDAFVRVKNTQVWPLPLCDGRHQLRFHDSFRQSKITICRSLKWCEGH